MLYQVKNLQGNLDADFRLLPYCYAGGPRYHHHPGLPLDALRLTRSLRGVRSRSEGKEVRIQRQIPTLLRTLTTRQLAGYDFPLTSSEAPFFLFPFSLVVLIFLPISASPLCFHRPEAFPLSRTMINWDLPTCPLHRY